MAEDTVLAELMELVYEAGMAIARADELVTPMLLIKTNEDQRMMVQLNLPQMHPADAMRLVLLAYKATHAALVFEGWEVHREPNPEDAARLLRQYEAGEKMDPPELPFAGRVRDQPDRFETFNLIGQVKGQDECVSRSWKIEGTKPFRTFHERDVTGTVQLPSNFIPLFQDDPRITNLVRLLATPRRPR